MISAYIESIIRRFCGRYIKKFSSEHLVVSVTGSISLSNIELNTAELHKFQLFYKPSFAFIGSVCIDFPVNAVLGGKLEVRVSDILFVIQREREQAIDPDAIHKALQTWISTIYLLLAQSENISSKISGSNTEYTQKLLDRLVISITNVHVRLEDAFVGHVPFSVDKEMMCLGILFARAEIRSPTLKELEDDSFFKQVTSKPVYNDSNTISVNKLVRSSGLVVYCTREPNLVTSSIYQCKDRKELADFVRKQFHTRHLGCVIGPASITVKGSASYQKSSQIFGPISTKVTLHGFDIHVNDEQISYLLTIVSNLIYFFVNTFITMLLSCFCLRSSY